MATFVTASGTGTFRLATPDGTIPRVQRALVFAFEHLPYSNTDIVDKGGKGARQLKWPLIILAAQIGGMEDRLGETGTLTETSFTETATLLELNNIRSNYDGTHYWAEALFVLAA